MYNYVIVGAGSAGCVLANRLSADPTTMLYVRGRPLDYDGWAAQGAPGWAYADVLPYFKRSEDNVRGASEFHGTGGELLVREQRSPRPIDRAFLEACATAGIPRIADYNGPEQDGASMFQVTQRDGRRWSSADAFLRPVLRRPNLDVRHRPPRVAMVPLPPMHAESRRSPSPGITARRERRRFE